MIFLKHCRVYFNIILRHCGLKHSEKKKSLIREFSTKPVCVPHVNGDWFKLWDIDTKYVLKILELWITPNKQPKKKYKKLNKN